MDRHTEFEDLRPLLFSIAYRVLGSVTEAEDAVQETWIRYEATDTQPESVRSFLSTVVTRVSIDVLRSARVRRERYVGPWMPEPLVQDPYEDPERAAELADSVSIAALLLLERLGPLERAVFVLREVFGFPFADVAQAVGRSEAACRQLALRGRQHMADGRPRFETDAAARRELAARFFDAMRQGDVDGLRELLAADVHVLADGGGGPGTRDSVFGVDKAAQMMAALVPPLVALGAAIEQADVNGAPGAVLRDPAGNVVSTWSLEFLDGRVQTIYAVNSPGKLGHLGPVGDLRAVVRERGARHRPS